MKNRKRASLYWGSLIVLILTFSPYLLYIYRLIPEDIESYRTIFGEIKAGYFGDVQLYVHWVFNKFVPLLLLSILYITNKKWWSLAILIPISVYLFQLIGVLNDGNEFVDEIEFIYTIPILIIVSLILFLIRKKLLIYTKAIDLKTEMDELMKKTENETK
ncbi:hypothetical protein R3X25_10515 [Lutibacter sp. TH_r2]|uniref:hypothetical protein n=1 Tax=Lutibacter sp. TH_r2 TaxID=3082083 RepID=UPI002955022F|nr:hypothetical protein [Lutibacter sp. TH_r2]MDV7187714.1 hypothetical protein [Lutibacter sp. TH_r2]